MYNSYHAGMGANQPQSSGGGGHNTLLSQSAMLMGGAAGGGGVGYSSPPTTTAAGGGASSANPSAALAYNFGSLRRGNNNNTINNTTGGNGRNNNTPAAMAAALARQQQAARQEELRALSDKFRAYEKGLAKVRLLWAEVLHVCPEVHVVSAQSGAGARSGKDLVTLRDEVEYTRAVLTSAGATSTLTSGVGDVNALSAADNNNSMINASSLSMFDAHGRPIAVEGATAAAEDLLIAAASSVAGGGGGGNAPTAFSSFSSPAAAAPHVPVAPHPLLVPSYPIASSDSYDAAREVMQRWVYSIVGVGLRSPHEHTFYGDERAVATEALIAAANANPANSNAGDGNGVLVGHRGGSGGAVAAASGAHHTHKWAAPRGHDHHAAAGGGAARNGADGAAAAAVGGGQGQGQGPQQQPFHKVTLRTNTTATTSAAGIGGCGYGDPTVPSSSSSSSSIATSPSLLLASQYRHAALLDVPLGSEPTVAQLQFLQEEVRRLAAIRDARLAVEDAVNVREGFVFYLQSLLAEHTAFEEDEGAAANNNNHASYYAHHHRTNTSNPFLAIELEWREGVEHVVKQLEAQINYFESNGDVDLASLSLYGRNGNANNGGGGGEVINATAIAQQVIQLQNQARANFANAINAGNNANANNGANNTLFGGGAARKTSTATSTSASTTFDSASANGAEAAAHQLLNTLTVAVGSTFAVPPRITPAAQPLIGALQIGLAPPPLLTSMSTLLSMDGSNGAGGDGDDEFDEMEGLLGDAAAGGDFGGRGTTPPGGNGRGRRGGSADPNNSSGFNPAAQYVTNVPMYGSKAAQMVNSLRLMREQLGALLHARPPVGFAGGNGSGNGNGATANAGADGTSNSSGANITAAQTKQAPIVGVTASTGASSGASTKRHDGTTANAVATLTNIINLTSPQSAVNTIAFGTAANQSNALRKALRGAVNNVRRSSFDVIKAVEAWRALVLSHPAIAEHNEGIYRRAKAAEREAARLRRMRPPSAFDEAGEDDPLSSAAYHQRGQYQPMQMGYAEEDHYLTQQFDPLSVLNPDQLMGTPPSSSSSYTPPFVVPIFFWRGSSYVVKMSSDLDFLAHFLSPLKERGALVEGLVKAVGTLVMRPLGVGGVGGAGGGGGGDDVSQYGGAMSGSAAQSLSAMGGGGRSFGPFGSSSAGALSMFGAKGGGGGGAFGSAPPPSLSGAGGGGGGAGPLALSSRHFPLEFCRLRKAQCYVLKYLQRHTSVGFFVREAVAVALAEALDRCDVSGNPFLNTSRKMPNYSVTYSQGLLGGGGGAGRPASASSTSLLDYQQQGQQPEAVSPLLIFFTEGQRAAIFQKIETDRQALERRGGIITAAGPASLIDRSSGLPTTLKPKGGLPDILKYSNSTTVKSYFNDKGDARREVSPATYQWAEGVVLGELIGMGRQLAIEGPQRLASATSLQEQIDGLGAAVAKATAAATALLLAPDGSGGDGLNDDSVGGIAAHNGGDGSPHHQQQYDHGVPTQPAPRSHCFDRLARFNAVLRHKEALAAYEERQQLRREGTTPSNNPDAIIAAAEEATAALTINTTARGVFVSPQTLAGLEAECAGIVFNSNMADIQYSMFTVFDPTAKPSGADGEGGGSDPSEADRQLILVLRRMGRNDPTLAAHLRIMAARKEALKAQQEREQRMANTAGSHNQKAANGGDKSATSMSASTSAQRSGHSAPKKPAVSTGMMMALGGVGTSAATNPNVGAMAATSVSAAIRTSGQIIRAARRQFEVLGTEDERSTFASIVRIQAVWRARQASKYTRALRFLHTAARSIQSVQKCKEAVTMLTDKRTQYKAAQRIQSRVRGMIARRQVNMLLMVIRAAVTIQRYYRGHRGRQLAAKRRQIAASAVAIQRTFKGYGDRKATEALKARTYSTAATSIQRMWRGGAVRAHGTADPRRIKAAVRIQSFWRAVVARRYVGSLRAISDRATVITSLVRAGHARHTAVRDAESARDQARARGLEVLAAKARAEAEAIPEVFELPEGSRYRNL